MRNIFILPRLNTSIKHANDDSWTSMQLEAQSPLTDQNSLKIIILTIFKKNFKNLLL